MAEDWGQFEEFANRPIAQYITGESWVNNQAHEKEKIVTDATPLWYLVVYYYESYYYGILNVARVETFYI